MLRKFLSIGLIALMLFSCLAISSAHTVIVNNKDSGNSQIAGTGHVKLYDTTWDVKKGKILTLNGVQYNKDRNDFLKFDTQTGKPGELVIRNGEFALLEKLFGQLTFIVEVRQFNGRSRYINKIDYVRVIDNNGNELIKGGSPSNLDNNFVALSVDKFGDVGYYNTQGFRVHLYSSTLSQVSDANYHNINGKDYYFKDFPPLT